jgi:hypothetical protein
MRDVFGSKRAASISPTWPAWPTLTERAYGWEVAGPWRRQRTSPAAPPLQAAYDQSNG